MKFTLKTDRSRAGEHHNTPGNTFLKWALCACSIVFMFALSTLQTAAKEVTGEQIEALIRSGQKAPSSRLLLSSQASASSRAPARFEAHTDTSGRVLFYVVPHENDEGFTVLSADDEINPIITIAETGTFPTDTAHPLYAILYADLSRRFAQLDERRAARNYAPPTLENDAESYESSQRWIALASAAPNLASSDPIRDVRVPMLLGATWGQGGHAGYYLYNYYTPEHSVCGCTATAAAMVLRYWKYPRTYVEPKTFSCSFKGVWGPMTTQGGFYDWDNMPLKPDDSITLEQRQAIGKLTSDIGIAAKMQYSPGSSGAYIADAGNGMKSVFGYASAINVGSYTSTDKIREAILSSLDARAPVIIMIDGHSIVGDGYAYDRATQTLLVHANYGWGGVGTWYNMPINGAIHQIVYNIFPREDAVLITGRTLDAFGTPVGGGDYVVTATAQSGAQFTAVPDTTTGVYAIYVPRVDAAYDLTAASFANAQTTLGTKKVFVPGQSSNLANSYGNELLLIDKPTLSVTPAQIDEDAAARSVCLTVAVPPGETIDYSTSDYWFTASRTQPENYNGPILPEDANHVLLYVTAEENLTGEMRVGSVIITSSSGARAIVPFRQRAGIDDVIYVNASVKTGGNGSSWSQAFKHLPLAIQTAKETGKDIRMAGGTYTIGSKLNIPSGITLSGGWDPETNRRTAVNPQLPWDYTNPTIIRSTVESGYSVELAAGNEQNHTILDGVTVREAKYGAVRVTEYARICNCTIRDNTRVVTSGGEGAGIILGGGNASASAVDIVNTWVHSNKLKRTAGNYTDHAAAGISCAQDGNCDAVNVVNCRITNNQASAENASSTAGAAAGAGGLWAKGNMNIINTLIANNQTDNAARAGGLSAHSTGTVNVYNCTIVNNLSAGTQNGGIQGVSNIYNTVCVNNNPVNINGGTKTACYSGAYNSDMFTQPRADIGAYADSLYYNGDYTLTAIATPLLNTGNNAFTADQLCDARGYPRIMDGAVDIGAYETARDAESMVITVPQTRISDCWSKQMFAETVSVAPLSELDHFEFAFSTDNQATWTTVFPSEPGLFAAKITAVAKTGSTFVTTEKIVQMTMVQEGPVYVSATGSDDNSGSSWGNAVKTLDKALEQAAIMLDKEIRIASGTYTLTATANIQGGERLIGGLNPATNEVEGYSTFTSGNVTLSAFTLAAGTRENNTLVQNIKVTGGAKAFMVKSNATIDNCIIDGCNSTNKGTASQSWGSAFELGNAANVTILNTIVRNCIDNNDNRGFINVSGAVVVKFANCLFESNTNRGTGAAFLQGGDWMFTNCTFVKNTRTLNFFSVGGYTFENCVFWGNTAEDVKNPARGTYVNCFAQRTKADGITALSASNTALNGPKFTNPTNHDYTLTAGSPLINAGSRGAWHASDKDLAGRARIQLAYVDVGAYESALKGRSAALTGTAAVYTGSVYAGMPMLTDVASVNARDAFEKEQGRYVFDGIDAGTYTCSGSTASFDFTGTYTIEPCAVQQLQPLTVNLPSVAPGTALNDQWIEGNSELIAVGVNNEELLGQFVFDKNQYVATEESLASGVFTVTRVTSGREAIANYAPLAVTVKIPAAEIPAPALNVTPKTITADPIGGICEITIANTGTTDLLGVSIASISAYITFDRTALGAIAPGEEAIVTVHYTPNTVSKRMTSINVSTTSPDAAIINNQVVFSQATYYGPEVDSVIYVSTTGKDTYTGGSWKYAKKTISAAINARGTANEIHISGGTYSLSATLVVPQNVILRGSYDAENGERTNTGSSWSFAKPTIIKGWTTTDKHADAVVQTSGNCTLDGLTISNGFGGGISNRGNNTRIVNCIVRDNVILAGGGFAGGIGLSNPNGSSYSGIVIDKCWVHNNKFYSNGGEWSNHAAGGISGHQDGGSHATITNCWITNNKAFNNGKTGSAMAGPGGLWLRGASAMFNCLVANNESENTGNRSGGIMGHSGDKSVRIINCTVVNNKSAATNADVSSGIEDIGYVYNTIAFNNVIANASAPQWNALGETAPNSGNNQNTEPSFVKPNTIKGYETNSNPTSYNYNVSTTSPCIDAGDDAKITGYTADVAGLPRIIGAHVDIGAYEYSQAGDKVTIVLNRAKHIYGISQKEFESQIIVAPLTTYSVTYSDDQQTWSNTLIGTLGTHYVRIAASDANIYKANTLITTYQIVPNHVYVSNTGSDENDGFSWDQAVRTLDAAYEKLGEIDNKEIHIAMGSYTLTKTETIRTAHTVIGGWNPATDQVEGYSTFTCATNTLSPFILDVGTPEKRTILRNIAVKNGAKAFTVKSNVIIDNCIIEGFNSTRLGKGSESWGSAFELGNAANIIIQNTIVRNCTDYNSERGYINVSGSLENAQFINCLFDNNTNQWSGAAFFSGGLITFTNCTFVKNTRALNLYQSGLYFFNNCVFWGNTAEDIKNPSRGNYADCFAQRTSGTGITVLNSNNTADNGPKFTNPSNHDYTLAANSILINRGSIGEWTADDKDLAGNARLQFGYPDAGAYERAEKGRVQAISVANYPANHAPNDVAWDFAGSTNAQDARAKEMPVLSFSGSSAHAFPTTPGNYTVTAENAFFHFGTASFSVSAPLYTVSVNGGTGGNSYVENASVFITLTDPIPENHTFQHWRIVGTTQAYSKNTSFTYIVQPQNIAFEPVFVPNTNYVNITVVGGTGSGNYFAGQTATMTVDPAVIPDHYAFAGWTKNGTFFSHDQTIVHTVNSPLSATSSVTYAAQYTRSAFQLVIHSGEAVDTQFLRAGDTIHVAYTAPLAPHMRFAAWMLDSERVSSAPEFLFTMRDTDVCLQAVTEQYQFPHALAVAEAVCPDSTTDHYYVGERIYVRYTGTTPAHTRFIGWSDDNGLTLLPPLEAFFYTMPDRSASLKPVYEQYEYELVYNDGVHDFAQYTEIDAPIELNAVAEEHFAFVCWVDSDGNTVSNLNPYTFTMPAMDTALFATFKQVAFELTVDNGNGAATEWKMGSRPVTVTAAERYHKTFVNWTDPSGSIVSTANPYTFDMPDTHYTLTAHFVDVPLYLLNVVDGTPDSAYYAAGETANIVFTGTAQTHMRFAGWYSDTTCISTDAAFAFTMPKQDVTLTAHYEQYEYELVYNDGVHNFAQYTEIDAPIELQAIAEEHFAFVCWVDSDGNTVSNLNPYTFNMPAMDTALFATFKQVAFELTVNNGNGTSTEWKTAALPVTVTAAELTRKTFVNWTDQNGIIVSSANPYTFDMPDTHYALTAHFADVPLYLLNVVDGTPDSVYYAAGETANIVFTGTAHNHMRFAGWYSDTTCISTDAAFAFTMPKQDVTLTAHFEQYEYELVYNDGVHNFAQYTEVDAPIELNAVAEEHFAFVCWVDSDGNTVSNLNPYTFTMPAMDTALFATFKQVAFELTVDNGNGAATEWKTAARPVTVTAATLENKAFIGWFDSEGRVVSSANPYTFVMPANAYSLRADYESTIRYPIVVEKGKANPTQARAGESVVITADAPAKEEGRVFDRWVGADAVLLDNVESAQASFIMPARGVVFTAKYKALPVVDTKFELKTEGSFESITLTWNKREGDVSYDIYRTDAFDRVIKVRSVKADNESMVFVDGDIQLEFAEAYQYKIIAQPAKTSSEKVWGMLQDSAFIAGAFGTAQHVELSVDSVAADNAIAAFGTPALSGYYIDPANNKRKKIALTVDKASSSTQALIFASKTEIPLYNSKNFNKRNKLATEFKQEQLPSMDVKFTIKKADATYKKELRTFMTAAYCPPLITQIGTVPQAQLHSDAGYIYDFADETVIIKGERFGAKNPKVWIEYLDNGKVKKISVKVKGNLTKDLLTKSTITASDGTSEIQATFNARALFKAYEKMKDGAVLVISNGKAFDAIEFKIKE